MEYENLYQDGMPVPPPPPAPRRKTSGRVRRIAASGAAAAVLLGGGAAIGIAMTGGASAATAGSGGSTQHQAAVAQCRSLAALAKRNGHPVAARRIAWLCRRNPLLRVVSAGGIYGSITFKGKDGTRTLAFERGTVASLVGSVITVRAVNGTTWTWDITASTVIRESGQKVAQSSLSDGEQVLVAGPVVSGVNDARLIRIRAAS
jgi:hypothetical protein